MPEIDRTNCLHRQTIAAIATSLRNMRSVLAKAEDHAAKHDIDMASLLAASLYPDMFNLLLQLQYACYVPADFAQHFSAEPAPRVGYDETTLAEILTSIDTTVAYLEAIDPRRVADRAEHIVPLFFDGKRGMPAADYAAAVTMPDFYFHVTVAYAILRHNGVPLGKSDFLGKLETRSMPGLPG